MIEEEGHTLRAQPELVMNGRYRIYLFIPVRESLCD